MSTRAVIARQTNDGWQGVYQHSDGYPTALGRELWSVLHHEHGGNVPVFLNAVIKLAPLRMVALHACDSSGAGVWPQLRALSPLRVGPPSAVTTK